MFKALRSARALLPDGDVRAERHVARACECSEETASELFAGDLALV
jgi:hypothetical protein